MKSQTPAYTATLLAAGLTITLSGFALAHSGATGIVKQRMDLMSDVGKSMKAIAAVMKGDVAFDANIVKTAAGSIATHAQEIPHLFPEGSNEKPSKALPAIWQDWNGFVAIGKNMKSAADALADVAGTAKSPADLKATLIAVGNSCKACHQKFRLAK